MFGDYQFNDFTCVTKLMVIISVKLFLISLNAFHSSHIVSRYIVLKID